MSNSWVDFLKITLYGMLSYFILDNIAFLLINYYRRYVKVKPSGLKCIRINYISPEIAELLKEKSEYHAIVFNQTGAFLITEKR